MICKFSVYISVLPLQWQWHLKVNQYWRDPLLYQNVIVLVVTVTGWGSIPMHTYTYAHTHIRTYTHTHIHTYTHTRARSIQSCVCLFVALWYINNIITTCAILLEDSNVLEVDQAMGRRPSWRPMMLWHSDIRIVPSWLRKPLKVVSCNACDAEHSSKVLRFVWLNSLAAISTARILLR